MRRDDRASEPARASAQARRDPDDVPLSVLLIDFDGLRAVNNVLGHQKGDELIRRVAAAIQESLEADELVARLHGSGGDEFVVCCPFVDEDGAVARAVDVEQHLMGHRLPSALRHLYRGASVGTSTRTAGESPIAFLERAASSMRERRPRASRSTPRATGDAVRRAASSSSAAQSATCRLRDPGCGGPAVLWARARSQGARPVGDDAHLRAALDLGVQGELQVDPGPVVRLAGLGELPGKVGGGVEPVLPNVRSVTSMSRSGRDEP